MHASVLKWLAVVGSLFLGSFTVSALIGSGVALGAGIPAITIADDNFGQAGADFTASRGVTLTNTVTWAGTNVQGRAGLLFIRVDSSPALP